MRTMSHHQPDGDHGTGSARLMPTEARGNYLPEAPYLRETKTYLNCNSRMHGYIEHA